MQVKRDLTDDGHWAVLSLRGAGIITSLPVVIALAWAGNHRTTLDGSGDTGIAGAFDWVLISGVLLTFLYSATILNIRLWIRRPIYPGLYIALDLVAFGILIALTAVFWAALQPFKKDNYTCVQQPCIGETVRDVEYFAGIMAFLNCGVHLVSFGWACWACRRYRPDVKDPEYEG